MSEKYIAAYTADHNNYPEYINFSFALDPENDGYGDIIPSVIITMREKAEEGKEGKTIQMEISDYKFGLLLREALSNKYLSFHKEKLISNNQQARTDEGNGGE